MDANEIVISKGDLRPDIAHEHGLHMNQIFDILSTTIATNLTVNMTISKVLQIASNSEMRYSQKTEALTLSRKRTYSLVVDLYAAKVYSRV